VSSPSFFSSEEFLGALASAVYPGKPWRREVVEVDGQLFRVLVIGNRVVDAQWNHPFRYDVIDSADGQTVRRWPYLAATTVELRDAPVEERFPWPVRPSPFVNWRLFSSWSAYERFAHQSPFSAPWTTTARLERKLGREFGGVDFRTNDSSDDVVPFLARFKGAHFVRTGLLDWFQAPSTLRIFDELRHRDMFSYATVRAGGRLVAAAGGSVWNGKSIFRMTTYDPAFGAYSPGRILLHHLLRGSFERGDTEFDFLIGYEAYKWDYATHARIVGPVGRKPRRYAIEQWARGKAGRARLRIHERIAARRRSSRV
jgi:hypothetical protein